MGILFPTVQFKISEGILHVTYEYGLSISYEAAREIVRKRIEYTNNVPYPLLILDRGVRSIDKEARDFFSSKDGTKNIIASALVLESIYSSLLGNFFVKITQPDIPVKIFTNKSRALKWLQHYKQP